MNKTGKKILIYTGVTVFWLAVWQGLCALVSAELLLPSPWKVVSVWFSQIQTSTFWVATGYSILRITIGFLLGVLAGCILAFLTTKSSLFRYFVAPILKIIRAAPVASFIILALVWIKTNNLPLFIAFLMVTPLVWGNMEEGIKQIDPKLLEMGKVYRFSKKKVLKEIQIPSVMPYLMAAIQTGLGFAWKSGIAAEVICRPDFSIGTFMQSAKMNLETPEVFAWTMTVILISVIFEKVITCTIGKIGKKYSSSKEGKS